MAEQTIQKPFLKWVGGKTQIINKIISKIPTEMNNYHEPFLGGGSVLLAVLSLQKQNKIKIHNKIYAYDINRPLINVYKHIQKNKTDLYHFINLYTNEYNNINGTVINRKAITIDEAKTSKESYYYWIRNKYNSIDKNTIECSALFMFLNKTCFRGMYREGPNGFNVPYGNYKSLTIITETNLNIISELIKEVVFEESTFIDSIKKSQYGDFIYFDPPYVPENDKSFVGYVSDGFSLDMHKLLFSEIKKLDNIKFIMSNSNVKLVTDSFIDYESESIIAKRSINSKNPGKKTTEIIIYN